MVSTIIWGIAGTIAVIFFAGIRVVRPTQRALVERLGKYARFSQPGFNWIIPIIERMVKVNVTEKMVDAEPQEIITKDKLNATVDAQIYFRVKSDEADVKNTQYNVNNCENQIISLARTTLRNIIGTMNLNDANSKRDTINNQLMSALSKETKSWGIEVVRTELKEISPPEDVQKTMNDVVKAENVKTAAVDYATAKETEADGMRRAKIKEAEGAGESVRIRAKADAEAIKVVNEAAEKYFKGNAQKLKQIEMVEKSLATNAKIIVTEKGISPSLFIGDIFDEKGKQ